MFDKFSVIRFSQSVALLLSVVLLASAGCRILSPKSSPQQPPNPPPIIATTPPPSIVEPDPYSAFRPITTEPFVPPLPQPEIISELPRLELNPDTAAQSKIEELTRKITELEAQVEEATKRPPVVENYPPEPDTLLTPPMEIAEVQKLPLINKPGVTVSSDKLQRVRILIVDNVLFMSNTWQLTAEGEETLRTIATEIRAFDPKADVDIEGHTDSLMGDPNNPMQKHDVSSTKAMTVMDFFVTVLRWDAARIGTSSFGRSRPVEDNGTPEGRARNNRIEIVLRGRNE